MIAVSLLALSLQPKKALATAEEVLGGHEGWLDRMGGGIRELGFGNAASSLEGAQPAAYWNPALLPFIRHSETGFGADIRSLNRNGGYFSVQGRVAGNLGMGFGVLNRGDYFVPAYDQNENRLGVARPQAFGNYVGLGLKTSRRNALGLSVQWYHLNLDIEGGSGNINQIGIFNFGWYRRFTESFSAGVVVRNLGLNEDLSSRFSLTTLSASGPADFDQTGEDFHPKTLVLSLNHRRSLWERPFEFAAEALDYQLKDQLFVTDGNFHEQAFRLGVNCEVTPDAELRAGYDRGNIGLGLSYRLELRGDRAVYFDYALLLEQGLLTFNPYGFGMRYRF